MAHRASDDAAPEGGAALRRSEQQFRLLVESVRDYAIFLLAPDGTVATWNSGAELIKGYSAEEIVGRHFSSFYPPDAIARGWPAEELRIARREGRVEDEGWRVRKDGTRFWANVVITALRDDDGALVGFAKVTRDLTERRAAEEQARELVREQAARAEAEAVADRIRRANEEAESARRAAEEARQAAEEASRAKSQFLAVMSHELRTPLNAILGFTDLLAAEVSGPLQPAQADHLRRIRESAWHLLTLIDQVLSLSRIEAGHEDLYFEHVDLGVLCRDAAGLLEPAAAAKGLALEVSVPEAPLMATTDPGKVRQILLNLLNNAVKFTDEGRVGLVLERDGGDAVIHVTDTGIGIDVEQQERIFELFTQVESASSRGRGGTGLGLNVTRQLAQLLGGSVAVDSRPGGGSRFTVRIPMASESVRVPD